MAQLSARPWPLTSRSQASPTEASPATRPFTLPRLTPWAVGLAAAVILALRHPVTLLRPEPWADEAIWFSDALARGAASALEPWAGYLLVGPRLVAIIETLAAPRWAPLVGSLLVLAVTAAVAALIASQRLGALIPSQRQRLLLAAGFVLVPGSVHVLVSLAHLQWILTAYLLVMAGTTAAPSRAGRLVDGAGLVIASLSGPGSLLLLPLFGARWLCRRDSHGLRMLVIVAVAAAVQFYVMTWAGRLPPAPLDLAPLPAAIGLNAIIEPLIGTNATVQLTGIPLPLAVAFAIAALALGLLAARQRPGIAIAIAYAAVTAMLLGILRSEFGVAAFLEPYTGERYFYLVGLAWVTIIVLSLPRWPAVCLALLLLVGATGDLVAPPRTSYGWASESGCIGGPSPCTVVVAPGETWKVEWAGR